MGTRAGIVLSCVLFENAGVGRGGRPRKPKMLPIPCATPSFLMSLQYRPNRNRPKVQEGKEVIPDTPCAWQLWAEPSTSSTWIRLGLPHPNRSRQTLCELHFVPCSRYRGRTEARVG